MFLPEGTRDFQKKNWASSPINYAENFDPKFKKMQPVDSCTHFLVSFSYIHKESTLIPISVAKEVQVVTSCFQMWHSCFIPHGKKFLLNPPFAAWGCASILILLWPTRVLWWLWRVPWGGTGLSGEDTLSLCFLIPSCYNMDYDEGGPNFYSLLFHLSLDIFDCIPKKFHLLAESLKLVPWILYFSFESGDLHFGRHMLK